MSKYIQTVKVDNDVYEISAAKATQVEQALVLKKHHIDNGTYKTSEGKYLGAETETIEYVDANTGGEFKGHIKVPNVSNSAEINDLTVLNYKGINDFIINHLKNSSLLYTCTSKGEISTASSNDSNTQTISIITGPYEGIKKFAVINANKKANYDPNYPYLAAFIGICSDETDKGRIFFGTADSSELATVHVIASKAETADVAKKLSDAHKIKIDLGTSQDGVAFDGSTDVILKVNSGVLGVSNGGTGATSLADVTVGKASKATQLTKSCTFQTNLASTDAVGFDGTNNITPGVSGILPVGNGGTGKSKLDDVTVGTAKSAKATDTISTYSILATGTKLSSNARIVISSSSPSGGSLGDIWIKY